MTSLFVVDLDGCISFPFVTPHWPSISKIRDLNILSRSDPSIPGLSICTGRPYPYAEAVAQWLDIDLPFAFESGGGIYFPKQQRVEFLDEYHKHSHRVDELKKWSLSLIKTRFPDVLPEFSKKTDVGFIHSDEATIRDVFQASREYVASGFPEFEVHRTEVSVNIILKACNKGAGIRRISQLTDIPLPEVAYIGDSSGDIPALKIVGKPFCPANATSAVKEVARPMRGRISEGVLEAYEILIAGNRNSVAH